MNEDKQRQKRLEYFNNIAERVQPLFEKYNWKLCNKVPSVKTIVEFLSINAAIVDESDMPFESGRFYIRKDPSGINSIGIHVYVDVTDSSWEF